MRGACRTVRDIGARLAADTKLSCRAVTAGRGNRFDGRVVFMYAGNRMGPRAFGQSVYLAPPVGRPPDEQHVSWGAARRVGLRKPRMPHGLIPLHQEG